MLKMPSRLRGKQISGKSLRIPDSTTACITVVPADTVSFFSDWCVEQAQTTSIWIRESSTGCCVVVKAGWLVVLSPVEQGLWLTIHFICAGNEGFDKAVGNHIEHRPHQFLQQQV